jgi:peptidoglycan/xylan/chitin deacetylase (PgdA/CDA1 family)
VKHLILLLAKYSGLFRLSRWYTRKNMRILAYHGIWMGEGHFGNFLYMSADKFSRRMQKIRSLKVPVLDLGEALRRQQLGTLPDHTTVITIDDGWYSTYLHMLPELEKHHFPATIYVTTYYCERQFPVFAVFIQYMFSKTSAASINLAKLGIREHGEILITEDSERERAKSIIFDYAIRLPTEADRQSLAAKIGDVLDIDCEQLIKNQVFHLISLQQLRDMDRRGFDLQLHTHRHRVFHDGVDCLEKELRDNIDCLKQITNRPLEHFCYPSGVYSDRFLPTLKAANVCSATTTEVGLVDRSTNRLALPRILDGELVSDLEFEAELHGFFELKRRLVRLFSGTGT